MQVKMNMEKQANKKQYEEINEGDKVFIKKKKKEKTFKRKILANGLKIVI